MGRRFSILLLAGILVACTAPSPDATPAMASTPVPKRSMPPEEDSWILVDLPPDATQLQHGAEIYRLVCSACHAHSGEGLTDAWRATWAPDDQNCWQSKCHAANHPPDGFELPIAPAVVGRAAMAPFDTAADLHNYIQRAMPWQEPNSMTEEEGWAVTAYVIKLNRMNPGEELNADTASALRLNPDGPESSPTPSPARSVEAPPVMEPWRITAGIALVSMAAYMAWRVLRRRARTRGD